MTRDEQDNARQIEEQAHLLDLTSLQDVATWVLQAAVAGAIGNAAPAKSRRTDTLLRPSRS